MKRNILGLRYGQWTVITEAPSRRSKKKVLTYWYCRCDCGNERTVLSHSLLSGRSQSCGCDRRQKRGKDSAHWKGGRYTTTQGYVMIFLPEHHRAGQNGYVLEHIVVMEHKLGRDLRPGETVHHKHGDRADNRPEHLDLMTGNHPPGQRVYDQVKWAKQIIATYGDNEEKYA